MKLWVIGMVVLPVLWSCRKTGAAVMESGVWLDDKTK